MARVLIFITNRIIKLIGNLIKIISFVFHVFFRKVRFSIPYYSGSKVKSNTQGNIPKIIWQTNYSNRCALPIYINYLFNRLMSLSYEYRYVSTEGRDKYLRENAPIEVYNAYKKITDGAAQADLWRVAILYQQGGVYMDIDATLVWPLSLTLKNTNKSLYIKVKENTEITNYFIATKPYNPELKSVLDTIVSNIENHDSIQGIYDTTGPKVFNSALKDYRIETQCRRYVCIQGAFTNEYFQYLDKPRGKWTHKKPEDLIKKP